MVAPLGHWISKGKKKRSLSLGVPALPCTQPTGTSKGSATFQLVAIDSICLLLAGDIESNPGPVKIPCTVCHKSVAINHRALDCTTCSGRCHIKCGSVSPLQYKQLKPTDRLAWKCPVCIRNYAIHPSDHLHQELNEGDLFTDLNTRLGNHGIKMAHLNVNGLMSKINQIRFLLKNTNFDIFAITETHLKGEIEDKEIEIENYDVKRFDRKDKKGGGCLIYYKTSLTIIPVDNIHEAKDIEAVWIQLCIRSQKFLVGALYRPPTDMKLHDRFVNVLSKHWAKKKNIFLLGDFNSDLLTKNTNNQNGRKLKRTLQAFDLKNIIKELTHIISTTDRPSNCEQSD
eukprot:Seg495.8 transcript_id=Seg495.8/GoldUCD/mRNA.D3Y31 product="hypothetical protein" protein_id=Seg495.8/GoldUCD/D3Y31